MDISLRDLKKEDSNLFYSWWNDLELRKFTSGNFEPMAEQEIDKILEDHLGDKEAKDFIIVANSNPIGHILIKKDENNKFFSIYIAIGEKEYWDKGYGAEALKQVIDWFWKKYPEEAILELEVNTNNPRAKRCYEKVGFKKIKEKKYKDSLDTFLMRLGK